jgi:preprotein translocase subunit SecG
MKNKIIIFFSILFFTIILLVGLFLYKPTKKQVLKITKETNAATIKTENFKLQQMFNNKNNKWILKANSEEIFKENNKAKCYKSKASFIKNNKKIAILNAPKTIFYLKDNKIKMSGGIKSKILSDF